MVNEVAVLSLRFVSRNYTQFPNKTQLRITVKAHGMEQLYNRIKRDNKNEQQEEKGKAINT